MNAKLTDADVFVLVTALLNKMDHPDTATVRSEVEILINHLDSAPNLDPTEDAALFLARPAAKDRSKFLIAVHQFRANAAHGVGCETSVSLQVRLNFSCT